MGKILFDKTELLFGYNPNNLRPSSEKIVVWQCNQCFIEQHKKYRAAKKINLCLDCSNKINAINGADKRSDKLKEWHKTHIHPLLGTKRPQNVLDALKNSHLNIPLSEQTRTKLSIAFSGENNPFYGKKHTEESLKKMREFQQRNKRTGENCNFYGKPPHNGRGAWYTCHDGGQIWMRSSWEIKVASYFDKNNIKWTYEPKTYPIKYNNYLVTYTPDFFLIDTNEFIEVKGWWRDGAKIKFESFLSQYSEIKISVWEKAQLLEKKIL